jgi:hypothetical protein
MQGKKTQSGGDKLDQLVAATHRNRDQREQSYREQALKLYPWVCGRCAREFTRETLQQLTVHHRDHNHDNNPADGSNWELLCVYCHDNEHQRQLEATGRSESTPEPAQQPGHTHQPFAALKDLLKDKQ